MPMTTICLRCGRPYFRLTGHKCRRRSILRLPRTRAARLAAERAEARTCPAAGDLEARIDAAFAMIAITGHAAGLGPQFCDVAWEQAGSESAGLPRPRTRAALYVVGTEDGRPGAA